VICGLPYVWLADRQPAPVEPLVAPVLDGDRYGGRPVYYSDVIVRHDSPISCLEELRSCSWAYNEPASHSGHTVTLYSLVRVGARPGFFARVVEAGFHQRAIRLVATGAVDAAAIDSQVLAIECRDHPQLAARLRIVDTFGAVDHPTRCGRQPPPRAAEGWGPGAASWTGRRCVGPAGARSRIHRTLRRGG
jgi:phosphonate transport system substrate-binding protein